MLGDAVAYCWSEGVSFDFVNENPQDWTTSPKAYAKVYIDDAALGCPLKENPRAGGKPYVDWEIVGPAVMALLEVAQRKDDENADHDSGTTS